MATAPDDTLPEADQLDGAQHPRDTLNLYGQSQAEARFLEAMSATRLHHAWLIAGPKGIGKATLAYRIARHLIADGEATSSGPNSETARSLQMPVDDPVFRRISAQAEPRLAVVRRSYDHDRKRLRAQIRVEDVRALRSFFSLSAADGGWRVAIIDAADEMNTNAANALLKSLEEPPERCVILLIAHQPSRLLPTVRSRTRALPCAGLSGDDLQAALAQQNLDLAPEVQALCDGSVGEAISLSQNDGMAIYTQILDVLGDARSMDRAKINALCTRAADRKAPQNFTTIVTLLERALARVARAGATSEATTLLPQETKIMTQLVASLPQARVWAGLASDLRARAMAAHAVNLDPAHVILDTFLAIETAAQSA